MRILMTQSQDQNLLAPQYFEGLKACGADVVGTYYHDLASGMAGDSFLRKVRRRIFSSISTSVASRRLEQDVALNKPEIAWIFKGAELYAEALRRVKSKVSLMANYNPDHPFAYEFRGSGNRHIRKAIRLYDLHFTYSRRIMEQMQATFPDLRTEWLPFGYPDKLRDFTFQGEEICRVCFIGYADEKRASVIQRLADGGLPIDVFGPRWGRYFRSGNPNVRVGPPLYGDAYWSALRAYRIQLNLLRKQNADAHNMRTFEVPAVGGIMLAELTRDHATFFEDGKEVFLYRDHDSLVELSRILLAFSPEQAGQVRDLARRRCLTSGYSYGERAGFVFNIFKAYTHA